MYTLEYVRLVFDQWQRRNLLRLTAKSTQFGRKTFTSWLIEATGTVPIKRRKDNPEDADNTEVMTKLMEALEGGDAVCLFPEGISRFHPEIAPLKTGGTSCFPAIEGLV